MFFLAFKIFLLFIVLKYLIFFSLSSKSIKGSPSSVAIVPQSLQIVVVAYPFRKVNKNICPPRSIVLLFLEKLFEIIFEILAFLISPYL
ncbi:MAG: hypothetical protein R3B65_03485 [Candidatus Paceibacterota bacterium]